MQKLVESLDGDYEKLAGMEFNAKEATRLIPDILQNDEGLFFPIFSTEKAMGEYGDGFSKIQKHILDAIKLARNNAKEPIGIVLNAFSEQFILDKDIWDVVKEMELCIQEER